MNMYFVVHCRRMRDDLQQLRDKTVELELKMDRVRGTTANSQTNCSLCECTAVACLCRLFMQPYGKQQCPVAVRALLPSVQGARAWDACRGMYSNPGCCYHVMCRR